MLEMMTSRDIKGGEERKFEENWKWKKKEGKTRRAR